MSSRPKVVVTDYITEPASEAPLIAPHADLVFANALHEDELVAKHSDAEAFIVFHDIKLTGASLHKFPKLRGIVRAGVGFDNVDLEAAGKLGIVVCNIPDYGSEDVADHALMMMLAITRRLKTQDDAIRQGGWDATLIYGAPRMRGLTLGILGAGRIGSAMALRGKALGNRVIFYDPYQPPGYEKALGVERAYEFDEFLPQCQVISLHTPLTKETRHILNAKTLANLPKGAYVVNTARGPCIDNEALVDSLDSGHIAAAALDVVEREPLDNEKLRHHSRVLLTPHSAFYSVDSFIEMRTKSGQEIVRILTNKPVRNPVNRRWLVNPKGVLPPVKE